VDQGEATGVVGQLRRVGLRPDPGRPERARAGGHETAREDLVALALADRVDLTGEQRLVELQTRLVDDGTVDDHLPAG
jgi:hypothetical protein